MKTDELETAVLEFIKEYPKQFRGNEIVEAMRFRIDSAVINLVNKGKLEVVGDWTLQVKL